MTMITPYHIYKTAVVTLVFAATTALLPAQDTLTIERCRSMALQNNKEIAAARQATLSAEYTAKSYRGNFFPNITASGTGLYSTADGTFASEGGNLPTFSYDATGALAADGGFAYFPGFDINYDVNAVFMGAVSVEQPIYTGGQITAAYRMAQLGRDIAAAQGTVTATEVIQQTDEAYADVVKAGEMCKVAKAYSELLGELMRSVESAFKRGMKPKNDVLKVQVKMNESELSLRRAENALRLAKMNLCHYIGMPLDSDISVATTLPYEEDDGPLQTFDISSRPEHEMLDRQVAAAEQQVKLSRSELLPKVAATANYSYLHGIEVNDRTLLHKGTFAAMLNVSIPLFHFGERKHKYSAAKAKLEQTRMERDNLNEMMLLELTQAANNVDEARLELDIARRSLAQAEENVRVSRRQYDAGMESLSDHLEAQTLWQQAYERSVEASYALYLAHVAYRKAAGTL